MYFSYLELAKNDEAEAMRKIRYHFSHMINGVCIALNRDYYPIWK